MVLALRILIFVTSITAGVLILKYTDFLVRLAGKSKTAEKYARFWGGTYLLWKIIGILVIILGLLISVNPCRIFGWWC